MQKTILNTVFLYLVVIQNTILSTILFVSRVDTEHYFEYGFICISWWYGALFWVRFVCISWWCRRLFWVRFCLYLVVMQKTVLSTIAFVSRGDTEHYFQYGFVCYSYLTSYLVICGTSSITRLSNMSYCVSSQFLSLPVTAATFAVLELAVLWERLQQTYVTFRHSFCCSWYS